MILCWIRIILLLQNYFFGGSFHHFCAGPKQPAGLSGPNAAFISTGSRLPGEITARGCPEIYIFPIWLLLEAPPVAYTEYIGDFPRKLRVPSKKLFVPGNISFPISLPRCDSAAKKGPAQRQAPLCQGLSFSPFWPSFSKNSSTRYRGRALTSL